MGLAQRGTSLSRAARDMGGGIPMVHIYHGDGKGKTTAAMGLALRAAGHGWRVRVAQFLKDGSSGEVRELAKLPGVEVDACPAAVLAGKFTFQMTPDELARVRSAQDGMLARAAAELADGTRDLVVLDEALDAASTGTLDAAALLELARAHGERAEIVLTGRDPAPELIDLADYVTEMRAVKHPYGRGVAAREGVEW